MRVVDLQDQIEGGKDGKVPYSDKQYWKDNTVEWSEEGECCAAKGGKDVGGFLKRNNLGDRI
jgi:hypothetical protein